MVQQQSFLVFTQVIENLSPQKNPHTLLVALDEWINRGTSRQWNIQYIVLSEISPSKEALNCVGVHL